MSDEPADIRGRSLRPDEQIRPCPHCGLPRYRRLLKYGFRWEPCGNCEAITGHAQAIYAQWERDKERDL